MANSISVVDQPIESFKNADGKITVRKSLGDNNPDRLNTGKYAEALSKFITNCETPLTIGIQGEWGSGKTSLLNMIREDIEECEEKILKKVVHGKDIYKTIWINTWEHSLLKTPEECLLSIIEEIIDSIAVVDGSWSSTEKAKHALATLAKGALRVGASVALGSKAAQVTEEIVSGTSSNSIKKLRNSLNEIIETIINRNQNEIKRFVIFIDDLDRLEPSVAVMILELLKNIFSIKHCVFVLAIDYQVVVKGLKEKFGEPNEENEWEFRAFFDKIIQLPFMMPIATYDLGNYVRGMMEDTEYFQKSELRVIKQSTIAKMVSLTVGHNPRSLKRLLNALSLIKIQNHELLESNQNTDLKQVIFALVCFQISFPRVYELLIRFPNFPNWNDEFVNKITGGPHEENKELALALDRAINVHEEDFDEDWEQALFKIVWLKKWQRKRLPETSEFLSIIKDDVLQHLDEKKFEETLVLALRLTAVTAVSSTDSWLFSRDEDENSDKIKQRRKFWSDFSRKVKESDNVFNNKDFPIRSTHTSNTLGRKSDDILPDICQIYVNTRSSSPLVLSTYAGNPDENYKIFAFFKRYREKFEIAAKCKISFKVSLNSNKQSIIFGPPDDIPKRLPLEEEKNSEIRARLFDWIVECLPAIEFELKNACKEIELADLDHVEEIVTSVDNDNSSSS